MKNKVANNKNSKLDQVRVGKKAGKVEAILLSDR